MNSNNVGTIHKHSNTKQQDVLQNGVVSGTLKRGSKKNRPTHQVYIPENLDLELLLENHPTDIPNAKDYLAVIVDSIHSSIATKKDLDIEAMQGFTRLYSPILKYYCNLYKPLVEWLENNGIIETDNSYSNFTNSGYSKGYRFTQHYRTKLKPYLVTTGTLVKKLKEKKNFKSSKPPILTSDNLRLLYPDIDAEKSYSIIAEEKLGFLKGFLNKDLKIDKVKAEHFLNLLLTDDLKNNNIEFPTLYYNLRKYNLDKLSDGEYYFHIDSTSGRLHTNLTNLKSELRNILTYKGQILSSIDLKNSQPLLSITFLDSELYKINNMESRIKIYDRELKNIPDSHYTMLLDLIQKNENQPDVILYKKLVKEGKIYEYFVDIMIAKGMIDKNTTKIQQRKEAKNVMFISLFAKNKSIKNKLIGKFIKLFQSCFPNVFEIFFTIKEHNHNSLACSLQNFESEIFLHKIAVNVHAKFPSIPKYTIHDSIATFSKNIVDIQPIVESELKKVLGFVPELHIETWDKDILNQQPCINSIYGFVDDDIQFSIKQAAELLDIGRNTLLKKLRECNILKSDKANINIPFDEYLIKGFFQMRTKQVSSKKTASYLLISENGLNFIRDIIN